MASVNKAILLGHLGKDPELRVSQNGKKFTNFSLATSERWNNEDHVEWHKVILFDRLAEVAKEYLRKGSQVYIEGRIQTRAWEDQQGNKRYTTEIIGNHMVMLGKKDGYATQPAAPAAQVSSPPAYEPGPSTESTPEPRPVPAPAPAPEPQAPPQPTEKVVEEAPVEDAEPLPTDGDLPF